MTRDPIVITPHNDVFLLNRDASNTPIAIAYTKETALLIAAQDDMLAALENLERLLAAYCESGFEGVDWHNVSKGRAVARAAIAKATTP